MYARGRLNGLLTALSLLVLSCGAGDDQTKEQSAGGACTPNATSECACLDGTTSVQTCLPSGDGLGPCDCGGSISGTGGSVSTGGSANVGATGGTVGAGGTSSGGSGGAVQSTGGVPIGGSGGTPVGGSGGLGTGGEPIGGVGGTPVGGSGGIGTGGVPTGGSGGTNTGGSCCADGNCICRGDPPSSLTSANGPYATDSYSLAGVGCIHYPTNAEPPFSAVAVSDGYLGTGGCSLAAQTSGWGPFYASYGIVTMIIETLGSDQPQTRGTKLLEGIAGFKAENQNSGSPLYGQLAGRYGTSGFSMGGGGTTYAATSDPTLLSSVALMAWTPTGAGVTVPTLFTCGNSDGLATCTTHGTPAYNAMPATTPKMIVTVNSGHAGQPSSGGGMQGAWGLAFQKLFLDGDERWRAVLLSGDYDNTNIQ